MPQQVWRCRVTFLDSGTLQDATSFGFCAEATGSDTNLNPDDVQDAVGTFLNTASGGSTDPIAGYLANNISRVTDGVNIAFTDITAHLDGSDAGPATQNRQITLAAPREATNTSDRLAICVGYRTDYGSAAEHGPSTSLPSDDDAIDQGAPPTHLGSPRPRARMRGRMYLGPFIFDCMDSTNGEPIAALLTTVKNASSVFFAIHNEALSNQWSVVVNSRRDASVHTTSNGFYYVNEGWATQRRRGDTTELRRHNWVAVGS
jgi:hypothetical protein